MLNEPMVKVILGPRRAGKSTFALQLCADKPAAWLNFDDDNLMRFVEHQGTTEFIQTLKDVYGDFQILILDEVQNLPNWELFVNRLHREELNLVITGSNANLLSRELATHLTGRYLETEILPFSWQEFKQAKPECTVGDYLQMGGFPEIALGHVTAQSYLSALADAILLKDIVARYSIRQPARLRDLYLLINAQFAQKFSISKIKSLLDFQSKTTLQNYLEHLKAAYLCLELVRYSHKHQEQIKSARKNYLIDLGFANSFAQSFDSTSRKLENLVFLTLYRLLRREPHSLYYYLTARGKEVDFMIRGRSHIKGLIQVCYSMDNQKTREREIGALLEAASELGCDNLIIVTNDTTTSLSEGNRTIRVFSVQEWLEQVGDLIE